MKRPFALIGFTYLAALCAAAQFDIGVCVALALLCTACAAILFFAFGPFQRRAALVTVLCTAGAAFAVYAVVWHLSYWPAASLAGRTAQVSGVVTDAPTTSGQTADYLIKANAVQIGGKAVANGVTLRVKMQESDIAPFSHVSFTAVLSLPSSTSIDGFNSQQYYRAKGVYLFATPTGALQTDAPTGFHPYALAIQMRQFLSARLQGRVGGAWGSLAAGILIGDVSNLPTWIKGDFTTTGISHILAVSGTQTSLIMQVLLLLFARLRFPRRFSASLTALAVLGFMAVTGFSPSVNRAGLMSLLYLGGLMLGREADALNSLGASVLVLCLLNPFAAMDTGLLLSFSATLGLVLLSGPCVRRMEAGLARLPVQVSQLLRVPGAVLCETVGATVMTLPVILLTFRQLSLVTLLSNMLEVPVSLLATLLAAVTSLLPDGWVFAWLVNPLALLLRLCCAAMMGYAHLLADLPFASVSTDYVFVYPVLILALAAALLVWRMRGKGADPRAAALCVGFALAFGFAGHLVAAAGVLEFAALPVENGNSTVLMKGGHAIVVDLYGYNAAYQITQWLKSHNVAQVDALILPEWDAKRQTYLHDLSQSVQVCAVYLPGACRTQAPKGGYPVASPVTLTWQQMTLTLYPSANSSTLLTTVRYERARAVLTGGAKADAADYRVPRQALQAAQLFYGGELSNAFVQDVSPMDAVFSGNPSVGAASGGVLGAQGCSLRGVEEQAVLSRTRGGAFLPVS